MAALELSALAAHFALAAAIAAWLRPVTLPVALRACVTFMLGLGLAAASSFWELQCLSGWHAGWRVAEVVAGFGAGVALWIAPRARRPAGAHVAYDDRAGRGATRALVCLVGVLAVSFAVQIGLRACASPMGSYDAAANWNLRARVFTLAAERWREFFANQPGVPHPDYPVLVPLSIARGWRCAGALAPWWSLGLGVACAIATVVAAGAGVAAMRGRRVGMLGAALLLATPELPRQAIAQVADVPVGCAFTLAGLLAWSSLGQRDATVRAWALCGLVLGVGLWTKNEGILFALLFALAAALVAWRALGLRAAATACAGLAVGALPFVLTLHAFKGCVPQDNELLPFGRMAETLRMLADAERWWTVLREIGQRALTFDRFLLAAATLGLLVARRGVTARPRWTGGAALLAIVLGAMLLGHALVAVTTPYAILFHIQTTEKRLLLQLWPLVVCLLCALVPDPWVGGSEGATR